MTSARRAGLGIVFVWFFFGGIGHFGLTRFFASIVPPYIPISPLAAVYLSGVCELAGAIGILLPRTRRAAGLGLLLLTLCVTPANVYMWQNPQLFPKVPPALLGARLLVQIALLACIAWSTWPRSGRSAGAPA